MLGSMVGMDLSPIAIFRAGRHTAVSGATLDFTDADLSAAATAYDPAVHEAPIVVGHPALDAPAYGWVGALSYSAGGEMQAHPTQVDPAFAELVNAGRYKKVSASWYTPDSPSNPKPGNYYLRHVGFLGAAAPAIKGLKQASFGEAEEGVVELEFSESDDDALWQRFTGWLFKHLTQAERQEFAESLSTASWSGDASRYKDANAYCDACLVDTNPDGKPKTKSMCHLPVREPSGALNRNALYAAQGALLGSRGGVDLPAKVKAAAAKKLIGLMREVKLAPSPSLAKLADFTESSEQESTMDKTELEQREADLAKREQALKDQQTALAARAKQAQRDDAASFAENLVKEGKLLPREKAAAVELLLALPADDAPLSFAEEGTTVTKPAAKVMRDFLTGLPKRIDYGRERSADRKDDHVVSFAAPPDTQVDQGRLELLAKARAWQASHPNTSLTDAVRAVGG